MSTKRTDTPKSEAKANPKPKQKAKRSPEGIEREKARKKAQPRRLEAKSPLSPSATAGLPRPTDLQPILDRLWAGEDLTVICQSMRLHLPSVSSWLRADPARAEALMRAREGWADRRADDALRLNRAAALGIEVNGRKVDASGAKGYLAAVQWRNSKVVPHLYGDRVAHEHTGAGGGPIEYAALTREQRLARIKKLQEKAGEGGADGSGGD